MLHFAKKTLVDQSLNKIPKEKRSSHTRHFLELLCPGLCKLFGLMNTWPLVGVVMY